MGKVIIQEYTTKNPITMIGTEAGICWGADIQDQAKNYKRGLDCLSSGHGRTFEFPDVYMILDGYSARVIREWYTHIGGSPTRLQASTRYINYDNFEYVTPHNLTGEQEQAYKEAMDIIMYSYKRLLDLGVKKEDTALVLPLGMSTKITCKHNARNLIDMSHQRMCTRAYWEYRELFRDLCKALSEYSEEWAYLVKNYFEPKCELSGFCTEKHGCGRAPQK